MNIVFCITCKGRSQHIKQTLPKNLVDNAGYKDAKFVILNYNSPDDLMDYLKSDHSYDIATERVVLYNLQEETPFRMAHAKNMAHRLGMIEGGHNPILVNLDADNYTGPNFAEYIARHYETYGFENFMWARMIPGVLARGISGRIIVPANIFLKLGGYDERFETWSRDDKDFNERMRRSDYEAFEIDPIYLDSVKHSDKMRFKEYPHIRHTMEAASGPQPSHEESHNTVVNFGRFGMGVVTRNFDPDLIELGPLPTRIFGIGMHKTGTTSLYTALKVLGYESAHWKSAHWAKTIWSEMNMFGKSLLLEHYYALTDLPITILYEKLDKAYPGSKFILTIRDEVDWLKSIKNHWDRNSNKFRSQWDTDPFTHKIHKEIYGQKGFDPIIFLNRYRKHNIEVLEYFKNRPNDLLVIDLDRNADWTDLCIFLDRPVPDIEYPKMNTLIK